MIATLLWDNASFYSLKVGKTTKTSKKWLEKLQKQGELDFVIEYKNKVLPIEVKSGKDYKKHSALTKVLELDNYGLSEAIVFTNSNLQVKGKITYLPIYMVLFLVNNDEEAIINVNDLKF